MVHVLAVAARVGEALQALGALEGLLAGVQTLVLRQVVLVLEGLGAVHALIGTLTCKVNGNRLVVVPIALVHRDLPECSYL